MKKLVINTTFVTILTLLFTACSSDGENPDIGPRKYISLFPHIKQSQTRVSGSDFEIGDAIGVFVVPYGEDNETPGAITESDYAPNTEFQYNGSTWQIPSDGRILWPPNNRKVDVYGYYPYNPGISNADAANHYFSIQPDQHTKAGYEASDFLWAKTASVSQTRNPVDLSFSHIMSKVRINIKTEINELEGLLPMAEVSILNTLQSANVSLVDGSTSVDELSALSPVITFRHADPAAGYLVSAEAIIVPQTIAEGTSLIRIDIPSGGARYTYAPTANIAFESGKERTFNITVTDVGLSVAVGSITEWQPSEIVEGEIGKPIPKVLDLGEINWVASRVQKIYDNGAQIGQVCREYLFKASIVDAQAIVVYSMLGDGTVDQSSGFVAQVMNRVRNPTTNIYEPNPASVHGGKVVWATNNSMTSYTVGTRALFSKVEFSSSEIGAAASNAIVTLNVAPDNVVDVDGNTYPIVKISRQYWMGENLKTEHYRDGTPLIYYYYADNVLNKAIYGGLYLWNTAMDARGIGPEGWSVPPSDVFTLLNTYLAPEPGRKLKGNNLWLTLTYGDNVTGFNALPGGRRLNTGVYNEIYYYGQWWTASALNVNDAYRVYMDYGGVGVYNTNLLKTYTQSLRLLRD